MARIHAARYVYYRMYIPVLLMYANFNDKKEIKKNGFEYVPPVSLRYRVSGNMNLKEFMDAGKHTAHDIENALKKNKQGFGFI